MEWQLKEIADRIKSALDMREVAEWYGLKIDRAGYTLCPFHHEKTPSMKIYPGEGGYHCFGCGASGDVIGFVMQIDGLTFVEACKKLNMVFNLQLPIGENVSRAAAVEAGRRAWKRRRVKELKERVLEGAKQAYWELFDRWLDNLLTIQKNKPKSQFEPFNEAYVEAVQMQGVLEYALDQAETRLYEAEKMIYTH